MQAIEKKQFVDMLTETLASYGKPLPDGAILKAWWSNLESFPMRVVEMAFFEYRAENGEFAPVPAGIAKRCRLMDGRPSSDEAWAIALTSRDEADTVVWTAETAEAFAICSTVFPDEVGARMAFKDAYNRLVSEARAAGRPAVWNPSLGWDARKREAAISRASVAGLLSAPVAAALLPPPVDAIPSDATARAQIDKIKKMMADMNAEKQREAELHAQRERNETAGAKQRANEMVTKYKRGDAA